MLIREPDQFQTDLWTNCSNWCGKLGSTDSLKSSDSKEQPRHIGNACLYSAASFHFVSTKSSECHEKRIEFYMKQMNLNLAMFYYVSCCTSRSSPEMKCPVSGAKRLMLYCT